MSRYLPLFAFMLALTGCSHPPAPTPVAPTPSPAPAATPSPAASPSHAPRRVSKAPVIATPVQGPAVALAAPSPAHPNAPKAAVASPAPPQLTHAPSTAPAAAQPPRSSRGIAHQPIGNSSVTPTPAPQATYRQPAPDRKYAKVIHIPRPGMREIPDNQMIACAFTEDIDPAALSKGDTFTVAVEPGSTSSFGSRTDMTSFTEGTLVEFVVEATDTSGKALCRARAILIPRDDDTDVAIPVATASLLPASQDQAVPGLNNRFEISQSGGDIGYKLGPFLHDKLGLSSGLGAAFGYVSGRMREDAAGDSVLRNKVAKDTPCIVRINRRILFR